jgi:hypothetical protein
MILFGIPSAYSKINVNRPRRAFGPLSQLFTRNYARASLHRDEIHEMPEIATLRVTVAKPRTEIARGMRAIAREFEGDQ